MSRRTLIIVSPMLAFLTASCAAVSAAEPLPAEPPAESQPVVEPDMVPPAISAPGIPVVAVETQQSYRIVGVGDIMMGSDHPIEYLDPRVTENGDPASIIGPELTSLFKSADVTFGNFEGTLHSNVDGMKPCSNPKVCFLFRSPPFHAAYLKRAGFTMISNANNHARDFGEANRSATFRNLTAAGFAVSGADAPDTRFGVQTLKDGGKAVLVAFGHNPGLMQVGQLDRVRSLVAEAATKGDLVIVSCHIGAEGRTHDRVTRATEMFLEEDRGNPFAFARAAVDAGADAVFCHGPHVPRAVEVYKGRFIAYSLGNFWTYGSFNLNAENGLAPVADITVSLDGSLISARIVSAKQAKPGGPVFDPTHAAAQQIAKLTARDFSETGVSVSADGVVSWPK